MPRSLIQNLADLPRYVPPAHSGTENARLVAQEHTGGAFEMVHGTLAPGGHAARHNHSDAFQAMYVLGGAADEVESRALGEAVMAELEGLDQIAYVRFASVYRSFRNVNQFMEELKDLLERQPGPQED